MDIRKLGDGDTRIRRKIIAVLDGDASTKDRDFLMKSGLIDSVTHTLRLQGTEYADLQPQYPTPCETCGSDDHLTEHHSRFVPDMRYCVCGHVAEYHVTAGHYGKCGYTLGTCNCLKFSRNIYRIDEDPYV